MSRNKNTELQERFAQEAITRGLEQRTNEEALIHLYARYCVTGEKDCLSDILLYAERLCWRIAWNKLANNTFFRPSDFEDVLQDLGAELCEKLQEDLEQCIMQENIVGRIRSFYANRSIDTFRKLCKTLPTSDARSFDELNEDEEGNPKDTIGGEDPTPFVDPDDSIAQGDLSQSLYRMYLSIMLNYSGEPQKVLSLCYARVLYHLQAQLDPDEIERLAEKYYLKDARTQTEDEVKRIEAIQKAQERKTATSVKWARSRMAQKAIIALTDESESVIKANYFEELQWGDKMRSTLNNRSPFCNGSIWGDLVYTEVFSEEDTTAWAQSIHTSVTETLCRQIIDDPQLKELVLQYDTPIKNLFRNNPRKGGKKHASDQR